MKKIIYAAAFFITGFADCAYAEVSVSPYMSFFNPEIHAVVGPGQYHVEPLYTLKEGMELRIEGRIENIISADIVPFICDENNLQKYTRGQTFQCWGGKKFHNQFSMNEKTYSDTPHYLVLYNPFNPLKPFNTQTVRATVQVKYTLPQNDKAEFEKMFNDFYRGLTGLFEIRDFNIKFGPCNERNAYSDSLDGDITMCSEILGEAHLKEKSGIWGGVLFHELGHTVLNLWGLPGWNNERTADEFAAVMLIIGARGKTDGVKEWIDFFDPSKEKVLRQAQAIAHSGGPHPLDVQRIEAMQQIIDNPLPVVKRWNNILYPRMKTAILQEIVAGTIDLYGADAELAHEILRQRAD